MQRVTGARATALLASLDRIDGDPDEETCAVEDDFTPMPSEIDFGPGCSIADAGEEDDHSGDWASEDEPAGYKTATWHQGPGCPVSDPGGCEHDGREPAHES